MEKEAIKKCLTLRYKSFVDYINTLQKDEFEFSKSGKWTSGQQLEHLVLGIRPLAKITQSNEILTSANFGRSTNPSRDYQEIVNNYLAVLKEGAEVNTKFNPTANTPFEPKNVTFDDRQALSSELLTRVNQICNNMDNWSEQELDDYVIPHPLLKKLTIREMMYFIIYHLEHHFKQVRPSVVFDSV